MTVPLNEVFKVVYGSKLDLNKMKNLAKASGGVNFVGRSSKNHGISGTIAPLLAVAPFTAGSITVALGGTMLLTSFVQPEPFYTAQNVAVLTPLSEMNLNEKIFICLCIRHNRFRYSAFGREANRTLRTLPIPSKDAYPKWLSEVSSEIIEIDYAEPALAERREIDVLTWSKYSLSTLFEIKKGKRLTKQNSKKGSTPFITAIDFNNGLRELIDEPAAHPGNVITVNYNGNGVAEAFYQPVKFFASDDVNVLYPLFEEFDQFIALFICTVIRREKYRFSYGRKWNLERMKESIIRLPASTKGQPDYPAMRAYIMSLPFSKGLMETAITEEGVPVPSA